MKYKIGIFGHSVAAFKVRLGHLSWNNLGGSATSINTQLGISNHKTYVALNSCICQLAPGVVKSRTGPHQPRAQYPTIQPLTRWIHDTLAISPLPLQAGLSVIGPAEAKLTHDEACG
jgi:hypothetical protein